MFSLRHRDGYYMHRYRLPSRFGAGQEMLATDYVGPAE